MQRKLPLLEDLSEEEREQKAVCIQRMFRAHICHQFVAIAQKVELDGTFLAVLQKTDALTFVKNIEKLVPHEYLRALIRYSMALSCTFEFSLKRRMTMANLSQSVLGKDRALSMVGHPEDVAAKEVEANKHKLSGFSTEVFKKLFVFAKFHTHAHSSRLLISDTKMPVYKEMTDAAFRCVAMMSELNMHCIIAIKQYPPSYSIARPSLLCRTSYTSIVSDYMQNIQQTYNDFHGMWKIWRQKVSQTRMLYLEQAIQSVSVLTAPSMHYAQVQTRDFLEKRLELLLRRYENAARTAEMKSGEGAAGTDETMVSIHDQITKARKELCMINPSQENYQLFSNIIKFKGKRASEWSLDEATNNLKKRFMSQLEAELSPMPHTSRTFPEFAMVQDLFVMVGTSSSKRAKTSLETCQRVDQWIHDYVSCAGTTATQAACEREGGSAFSLFHHDRTMYAIVEEVAEASLHFSALNPLDTQQGFDIDYGLLHLRNFLTQLQFDLGYLDDNFEMYSISLIHTAITSSTCIANQYQALRDSLHEENQTTDESAEAIQDHPQYINLIQEENKKIFDTEFVLGAISQGCVFQGYTAQAFLDMYVGYLEKILLKLHGLHQGKCVVKDIEGHGKPGYLNSQKQSLVNLFSIANDRCQKSRCQIREVIWMLFYVRFTANAVALYMHETELKKAKCFVTSGSDAYERKRLAMLFKSYPILQSAFKNANIDIDSTTTTTTEEATFIMASNLIVQNPGEFLDTEADAFSTTFLSRNNQNMESNITKSLRPSNKTNCLMFEKEISADVTHDVTTYFLVHDNQEYARMSDSLETTVFMQGVATDVPNHFKKIKNTKIPEPLQLDADHIIRYILKNHAATVFMGLLDNVTWGFCKAKYAMDAGPKPSLNLFLELLNEFFFRQKRHVFCTREFFKHLTSKLELTKEDQLFLCSKLTAASNTSSPNYSFIQKSILIPFWTRALSQDNHEAATSKWWKNSNIMIESTSATSPTSSVAIEYCIKEFLCKQVRPIKDIIQKSLQVHYSVYQETVHSFQ